MNENKITSSKPSYNWENIVRGFPWLKGVPEISTSAFVWEENEADNSFLMNYNENNEVVLPEGWLPVGFADARDIRIRPRPGQIVVMFEFEDKSFWLHIQ